MTRKQSDLERAFETYWVMFGNGIEPTPEFQFHPVRKWRFDFCWVNQKVACELDGGVYTNGRHVRGKGFENDIEKLNVAVLNGWKVLRFTTRMLNTDPITCIEQINHLLETRNG